MDAGSKVTGLPFSTFATQRPPPSPLAPESGTASAQLRQTGALESQRPVEPTESPDPSSPGKNNDANRGSRVEDAVKEINDFFQSVQRTLQFSLDRDSGRMVIQIKDAATNEVIRQIPEETVLKLAQRLGEVKGLLLETKA